MATPEQWKQVQRWHEERGSFFAPCIIELRDRLAALEAQQQQPASPEPTQRTEPEVQRELWEAMRRAWFHHHRGGIALGYSAEIDVVAQWLACNGHHAAADAIRLEARRARGEA